MVNECRNCRGKVHENDDVCAECGCDQPLNRDLPTNKSNSSLAIIGWVSTCISLLFIPILFGPIGVLFGYLHKKIDNSRHGNVIMIAAVIASIIGYLLGYAAAAS